MVFTIYALVDDAAGDGFILQIGVPFAFEQGVHVDEGGPNDHQIDKGIEHEQDEEDDPLISMLITNSL